MITLPGLVLAQEEGEAAAKQTNMLQKWVIDGGWTMIPLVILFFITLMLVVYTVMQLNKKHFAPAALRDELVALMSECRVQSAIKLATESPTYLGRLVAYALPNVDANRPEDLGKDAVSDAVADFTANERPALMRFVDLLALCGSTAPTIGLFGTIQGMVEAFAVLAETGQADPTTLAGSISVALLTTFWGLIISLIALPVFYFLNKSAKAREAECINAVEDMMNAAINTLNGEAMLARIPEGFGGDDEEAEEEEYEEEAEEEEEA
ncbi:MAG: MotA/TolQ/ExbB proton channel family protein [Akkermansia sp.]|nr:MotA/TolQ/ExbB proton channel family protein [Akkermansia sp.]